METLKNATTNVWQIADLATVTIQPYVLTRPPQLELFSTVETLRRADILCWLDHEALLVFELKSEPETQGLESSGLHALEKLSWSEIGDPNEQRILLDKLGAAIAVQISPDLRRDHQLHLIGKTTWAHRTPQEGSDESLLLKLHLRAASGTLYLVLNHEAAPDVTSNASTAALSPQVTLAPTGMVGKVLGRVSSSGQLYFYTSLHRSRNAPSEAWMTVVIALLRCYGVATDSINDWILVRFQEYELWWPSTMCFGLDRSSSTPALTDDATVSPVDHLDSTDTLSFAETWLMSSGQRKAEIESERLRQVQPDVDEHIDLSQSHFDLATAVSPPYVNRPDLMNALNVYPTPPDGMNIAALPRSTAPETTMQNAASTNEHDVSSLFRTQTNDDDMLLDTRERGPSIASSVGQPFRQSMNDLFGEADAELGSAEIGDHDFDFFDEQDDVVMQDHVTPPAREATPVMDIEPAALSQPELHSTPEPALAATQTDPETGNDTAVELPSSPAKFSPAKQHAIVDNYKPLSPFDVRERLLPPPIPASLATQANEASLKRRSSTFEPVVFNNAYRSQLRTSVSNLASSPTRAQILSPATLRHDADASLDDTSDATSDEDEPSRPANLPWQRHTGLRHRGDTTDRPVTWEVTQETSPQESSSTMILDILQELLSVSAPDTASISHDQIVTSDKRSELSRLLDLFSLDASEIIHIVQLCAQQAVSCIHGMLYSNDPAYGTATGDAGAALLADLTAAVSGLTQTLTPCDINSLALVKETLRPNLAAFKRQPGAGPRTEVSAGPDMQHVPAPYMRFNRADTSLELLPPAIEFWEELNLGPYTGSKDIALFCIGPHGLHEDLGFNAFVESLTAAYEGSKLGSVDLGDLNIHQDPDKGMSHFVSLLALSAEDMDYDPKIYAAACVRLAESLASTPPSRTVVVLMVEHPADDSPHTTSCASFHLLHQKLKEQSISKPALRGWKLCLQTVPYTMFEHENLLTVLSSQNMAMLAREIYDRYPITTTQKLVAPLPILGSPATILADILPKRIGLQLVSNPPSDLLHENSELHVAFSTSTDGQWMTVCWLDSTGWSQQTSVFSLRDQEMLKVVAEIFQRTLNIMGAKDISWRVVVATDDALSIEQAQLWRHVVAAIERPRRVMTVSLLALDCSTMLRLATSGDLSSSAAPGGSTAFLTPVSTPQGSSFPFSPEASAQGTPSTPAPSDAVPELEGDTNLVDFADETWRILLKPELELTCAQYADRPKPVASAVICKQGQSRGSKTHELPLVAVDIIWSVRIRAGGGGLETLNIKTAEHMLRDSLTTYRGLALLAKVRGLARPGEECVPLHIICARRGVSSVDGL